MELNGIGIDKKGAEQLVVTLNELLADYSIFY